MYIIGSKGVPRLKEVSNSSVCHEIFSSIAGGTYIPTHVCPFLGSLCMHSIYLQHDGINLYMCHKYLYMITNVCSAQDSIIVNATKLTKLSEKWANLTEKKKSGMVRQPRIYTRLYQLQRAAICELIAITRENVG